MTEAHAVKLEPCPRCRSPFVEVTRAIGDTVFSCSVCMLQIKVPVEQAEAVKLWNDWDRRDGMLAAAEGTAAMAKAHVLDTANKATRLERLVVALVGTGRVPGVSEPALLSADSIAGCYVSLARAIERQMDATRQ